MVYILQRVDRIPLCEKRQEISAEDRRERRQRTHRDGTESSETRTHPDMACLAQPLPNPPSKRARAHRLTRAYGSEHDTVIASEFFRLSNDPHFLS